MDKRKIANQQVKDKLLSALIALMKNKDWSQINVTELIEAASVARASFYRNFKTMEELVEYGLQKMAQQYHEGSPSPVEDFHDRELMQYKFRFYREHGDLILAFHHAKASISLLDVITDCVIDACGNMPSGAIHRYELYYYAGAFYNMILYWLGNGAKETPEAMADEYLRIVDGRNIESYNKNSWILK